MAAGVSSHIIEILIKMLGSKEAKRELDAHGNAVAAMSAKTSAAMQSQARLFQGLAASMARLSSMMPTGGPLSDFSKNLVRAGSASLGTANALKGLNLDLGKVAIAAGAAVGGIIAIAGAFNILKRSVVAAADSQEAIIKLGNALRTQGRYTQDAVIRATDFANAMQLVTKYTDEEILATQALLAQLGRLSGQALEDATRATLDLAAGLGRELPVAALIMAKAAQGSTWELRKYGLVVDENIPRTERWAKTLEFVRENFGGRAEAELRGFNATVRQLGGAFKDVLTVIGAPVVIPLTKALRELSEAALNWAAARNKMVTEALIGPPPDLQKLFAEVSAAEAKLKELEDRRKKQGRTGPVPEGERARDSFVNLDKNITIASAALENHRKRLQEALNEYAKLGPIKDALKIQLDLQLALTRATEEYDNALANAGTNTKANEDKLAQLARKMEDSHELLLLYQKALSQRIKVDVGLALDDIGDLNSSLLESTKTRDLKLEFKDDRELKEVEERLQELMKEKDILINLDATLSPEVQAKIDQEVERYRATFKLLFSLGNVDQIEKEMNELRNKLVSNEVKVGLSADEPVTIYWARRLMDLFRNELTKEGPAVVRAKLLEEDIRRINQVTKSLQSTFATFGKEEVRLIDPEEITKANTLDRALGLLKTKWLELQGRDAKQVVQAYNQVTAAIATLAVESEEAKKKVRAFWEENKDLFGPLAKQAEDELEAFWRGEDIFKKKIPSIKAKFKLFLDAESWTEAQRIIGELRSQIELIQDEEVRARLILEADKYQRDLDEAMEKAARFRNETSALKTTINLAIRTGDFDIAIEKINELDRLADRLTSEKLRLIMKLEVKEMRQDLTAAVLETNKFGKRVTSEMNSTMNSLMSMPWDSAANIMGGVFDGMVNKTRTTADAIKQIFTDLVDEILRQLARIAILDLLADAFTGPAGFVIGGLEELTGGGNFKPTPPGGQKLRVMPSVEFSRMTIPVPVQFIREEPVAWGKPGFRRSKVEIKIDALDASSVRKSLETGILGREISRMFR